MWLNDLEEKLSSDRWFNWVVTFFLGNQCGTQKKKTEDKSCRSTCNEDDTPLGGRVASRWEKNSPFDFILYDHHLGAERRSNYRISKETLHSRSTDVPERAPDLSNAEF